VAQAHTVPDASQPNDLPNGGLVPTSALAVEASCGVARADRKRVFAMYPLDKEKSVANVHTLARIETDRSHCSLRRRALLFEKARPGKAFGYRFNHWYVGNVHVH
jgi:hypothetical protein